MSSPSTSSSIYILLLKTSVAQSSDSPDTESPITSKRDLHAAYHSRQAANAAARRLLRQWGRVEEEWMGEDGLVVGRTTEGVKVRVVRVPVMDAEDEDEDEEE